MPDLQVKKVVAVCFLESAKLALEHVGAHRLKLSQEGVEGSEDLLRVYADVRRLRDYLQRSVSGYQDLVVLDLSEGDASLLVACCRRSVEAIEVRLVDGAVPPDEQQWLTRKRQVLGDWAVEMATKPLTELPLPRLSPVMGVAVRGLTTKIQNKIFGDVSTRTKYGAPQKDPEHDLGHPSMAQGIATFGETLAGTALNDTGAPTKENSGAMAAATAAANAISIARGSGQPSLPPLIDRHKIRDPRLRSLISVDMNAFDRCQQEADFRLATVLLASILESAILDHAIPRRVELELTGTPDTWNVQEVLLLAMDDAAEPKDRALSFHLFASRNLLRPALQMVTPAVVTATSFERLHEFATRAVHALGFGAPAKTLPPGAIKTEDLPQ